MTYAQAQMDARRQGKNEGALENAQKVAASMYADNIPISVIVKYVGYSEKEVAEWLGLLS